MFLRLTMLAKIAKLRYCETFISVNIRDIAQVPTILFSPETCLNKYRPMGQINIDPGGRINRFTLKTETNGKRIDYETIVKVYFFIILVFSINGLMLS